MILRFSSGSVTPARAARNGLARVDDVEVDAGRGDEVALDLLGLALAQQPVVDEDAGAAGRRWRAARSPRRRPSRRHRTGRRSRGRCRRSARGSRSTCSSTMLSIVHVWRAAGDVVEEVLEHLLAVLGVQHLGVPLDAGETAVDVLERGDRGVLGRGQHGEALGRPRDRVAVRHPDLVLGGDALEEGARLGDGDRRTAVLARAGVGDLAAEAPGHQLEAVAHPEDRHPGREDVVSMPGAPSA